MFGVKLTYPVITKMLKMVTTSFVGQGHQKVKVERIKKKGKFFTMIRSDC